MAPTSRSFLIIALALTTAGVTSADTRFGGPDSVESQLEEDERETKPLMDFDFLQPYLEWKEQFRQKTGIHFGGDYTTQALFATESLGEETVASGMARFFGTWDLVDRDGDHPGAFVWKVEHRHSYTDAPPSALGFQLGYVGLGSPPFSDQGWRVTNLYWRQRFANGRFAILAGFLDATDYVDVYPFASPWTGFSNLAFSTGSASIALPNDALLGIAAAAMITDNLYVIGGFGDANGDPEDPFEGFETFFEDNEYFSSAEIGWTSSHEQLVTDNVHVTFWHVDERDAAGTPDGWGLNLSATTSIGEHWMPFVRAGWSKDGGSLLDISVSTGFGFQAVPGRDLLGLAVNWGRPNEDTFGPGLDDQWAFELFYRWQLLREIVLTPSIQLLVDPALNPDDDTLWVFGLRLRYGF
jgi:porin